MTQPIGPYRLQSSAAEPHEADGATATTHAGQPSSLAQRALSYIHADAFFASVGVKPQPDCAFDEGHDYERCGDDAPIVGPVLYMQQTSDAQAIAAGDVHQSLAGDCALMATLAALASSPTGRALVENAIKENKNSQGDVVSYTVTMHEPKSHYWGLAAKTFSEVKVTVQSSFVLGHALPRGTVGFDQKEGPHEVWPLVLEQAYAAVRGGYNQTSRGDAPFRAMEALTGKPADQHRVGWLGYSAEQIAADCAAGKLVVLDTKKSVNKAYQLVDGHAYQVVGTEVRNGKRCFTLNNPWNEQQPDPIPCDELTKWFAAVDVGSVQ
ncbi:MAG: C2 family cysteine protease [Polyangiaceae bacterium]